MPGVGYLIHQNPLLNKWPHFFFFNLANIEKWYIFVFCNRVPWPTALDNMHVL